MNRYHPPFQRPKKRAAWPWERWGDPLVFERRAPPLGADRSNPTKAAIGIDATPLGRVDQKAGAGARKIALLAHRREVTEMRSIRLRGLLHNELQRGG